MAKHIVIPDTQVKPGVPLDHLRWIGKYIVEQQPDVIVHLGDHADMESLSSYDRGKLQFEGRRYKADIEAAKQGWDVLNNPIEHHNGLKRLYKEKQYRPRKIITLGNHEDRINRLVEENAELEGLVSIDSLELDRYGWEVHKYLKPVCVDGVHYVHYVYNPMTGRPYGGTAHNRLKNVGFSFTMGHQQTKDLAEIYRADGSVIRALICGACYLHDEKYKGPQGNNHWRGIIVKHEVESGRYDLMEVSLDYLCRKYEGKPLSEYKPTMIAGA
jgi:hypothetical protein